ncbi:hypothetical protein A2U01_0077719, partial [Trifolium medium]|nr:hypothetical protein [Trifolium medium]
MLTQGFLPTARRTGSMARCAVDAKEAWNCFGQLRAAQERMARRVSQLDSSGKLCHWHVAQLHMARRVPSMFIARDAQ